MIKDKKGSVFCSFCGKKIHRTGYRFPESDYIYCNECVKNEFAFNVGDDNKKEDEE